jgi:hypothetical protein
MTTVKLTEITGTKYLYQAVDRIMTNAIREHGADTIDVCGARIARECAITLYSFQQRGVRFVDSENKYRDRLFALNRTRDGGETRAKLPEYKGAPNKEELTAYIGSLNPETPYAVPDDQLPLGVLVSLVRPKIPLDFGSYKPLFEFVSGAVFPAKRKWDRFKLLQGTTFIEIEAESDGTFLVPRRVTYDELLRSFPIIPGEFGERPLNDDPAYKRLFHEVEEALADTDRSKSLIDYLGLR